MAAKEKTEEKLFLGLLKDLGRLLGEKKDLDAKKKVLNAKADALQLKLVPMFEHKGIQNIALTGIGMFYLNPSTYVRIEDEGKLFAWLRENKLDSIIKTTVLNQTLRGFVNERLEANLPVPEGVKTYSETEVRLRKA